MNILDFWKDILFKMECFYFKRKYSNLPSKIYYDKKFKTYVNPKLLIQYDYEWGWGSIEYLSAELINFNVFYNYKIDGENRHGHDISEVFRDSYNESEKFFIPAKYENQYSQQELNEINKLIEQGKKDRKV